MHSHRTGFSPAGFYWEAEKQFWQRLVMEERPHRCEGWAEKDAFQQEIVLCLSSLNNKPLFHRVNRNGRTLLSLNLGFSGVMNKGDTCLRLPQGAVLYLWLMVQLCALSTPWDALLEQTHPRVSSCRKLHVSSDGCVIAGAASWNSLAKSPLCHSITVT